MRNKFLLHSHRTPECNGEFDPERSDCLDEAMHPYFGRVLHHLNRILPPRGLTFVVTTFNMRDLPEYGPHVVACILEDELSREPRYRDRVAAVFRCYPNLPSHLNGVKGFKPVHRLGGSYVVARDFLRDGTGRSVAVLKRLRGVALAPVFEIPIGCNAYAETAFVPFAERDVDAYFCGSISHLRGQSAESVLARLRPKSLERLQMKQALDDISRSFPEIKVDHAYTGSFEESVASSQADYLEGMMNAKFCLAPRGGVPHTYRFFEAVRFGTIPIGETFPDSFEGAPFVRLRNWKDLPNVLEEMLREREGLNAMHEEALQWWNDHIAETVIAAEIRRRLESCLSIKRLPSAPSRVAAVW